MQFHVWGRIDGKPFDAVFANVAEWRAERQMIERHCRIEVLGIRSA